MKKLILSAAVLQVSVVGEMSRAANIDHVIKASGNVTANGTYSSGGAPSNSPGDLLSYNLTTSNVTIDINGSITIGVIRKQNTGLFSITNLYGNSLTLDGTGLTANPFGAVGVAAIANSSSGSLSVGSNISMANTALDVGTTASTGSVSIGGAITATNAQSLNYRNNAASGTTILDSGDIGVGGSIIAISNLGTSAGTTTLTGTLGTSVASVTERGTSSLILTGANTYTGATTVGTSGFIASGGTLTVSGAQGTIKNSSSIAINGVGSTLNLDNSAGSVDRIGAGVGVTIGDGGELALASGGTGTSEVFGALSLASGTGVISVAASSNVNAFSATSFARGSTFSTALIRGSSLGSANAATGRVFVGGANATGLTFVGASTISAGASNSDATKTLKIVPYLIGDTSATGTGNGFVTYDSTFGIRALGSSEYDAYSTGVTGANIKNSTAITGLTSKTFNALLIDTSGANLTGTSGSVLSLNSGAIFFSPNASGNAATISGFDSLTLGNGTWNEGVITVGRADNSNALGALTIGSAINVTSGGGLTKTGGGNLIVAAASGYTGATTINQGTLTISGSLADGSGAVTVNNGTTLSLAQTNGSTFANDVVENGTLSITNAGSETLSGNISGSGAITQATAGTSLSLRGNNSYLGATNVAAGILNIQNSTALGAAAGGAAASGTTISSGATLQLQGSISVGAEALSLNGGGASGQTGALVNVSGMNSYGGLVALAGSSTISSDADTLNLTNTGTITGSGKDLTLAGAGNGNLSSVIGTTSGKLLKAGAGTWTVGGLNSYTGATSVNGGNLSVTGSIASAAVTVGGATAAGGLAPTLSGTGVVSGSISIASAGGGTAGTISAGIGSTPGTLSTGALYFGSGATWNVVIGSPGATNTATGSGSSNKLAITGDLVNTAGELMTISAAAVGTPGAGSYRIATYTGNDTALSSVAVAKYGSGATQLHGKLVDGGGGAGSTYGIFLDEYRLAAGNTLSDVSFGSYHVGAALSRNVVLTNTAANDGFSEKLTAANSATAAATVSPPTVTQLTAQMSTNLMVGLNNSAGVQSGTVVVGLSSDGAGTSGAGTTALIGQTINVSGTGYNLAAANAPATPVNLGIIHVNQSFGSSGVAINNGGPAGSFTEGLDASTGTTTGAATGSGSISDLRPAGGTNASNVVVSLGGSTAVAGTRAGTVAVNFASDGTLSGLANTSLASQVISVNGQVNDYAAPRFTKTSGSGIVTSTSATSATVDFGSVNQGSGTYTLSVALLNSIISAYEDSLGGSFDTSGVTDFTVGGFSPLSAGGIAPGSSQTGYTIALSTGTVGSFSNKLIFSGTSINASSTSGLSPFTLTINGTVVAVPEPTTLAMLGLGGYSMLHRRRRRVNANVGSQSVR